MSWGFFIGWRFHCSSLDPLGKSNIVYRSVQSVHYNSRCKSYTHRIHGAGIYANIKGVYWWDPCYHIYSSTMDPSWDRFVLLMSNIAPLIAETVSSLEVLLPWIHGGQRGLCREGGDGTSRTQMESLANEGHQKTGMLPKQRNKHLPSGND